MGVFAGEAGGHRWQRVPPTEKRGRVHTSTLTVAVLAEPTAADGRLDPSDLEETFTGGGGKGGQHQNKRSTAVVLVHRPTGIRVRIESRSQHANRRTVLEVMRARVAALHGERGRARYNRERQRQVGSGMRGDKVRTVRVRHRVVVDHRTGKRTSYRRYTRGYIADLR
jgi:peptide chain release factor 1